MDRQIAEMMDAGVMEPSTSPWSSAVVLAKIQTAERFNRILGNLLSLMV